MDGLAGQILTALIARDLIMGAIVALLFAIILVLVLLIKLVIVIKDELEFRSFIRSLNKKDD